MVALHPAIVSISEFFGAAMDLGGRTQALFPTEPVDGGTLWDIFGVPGRRISLLLRHRMSLGSGVLYPSESPNMRYNADSGIPMVLLSTIPHLSDSPDAAFDELREYVLSLPTDSIGTQYGRVFEWFRTRFDGELWVERSGASLYLLEDIRGIFPDARFVHVTRDGRNAACSMREHRAFRMFVIGELLTDALGVDPYYSSDRGKVDRLSASLRAVLPERFDRDAFDSFEAPLSLMGKVWSEQISRAYGVLDTIARDRQLTVRYEDLIANPADELTRLAEFLGEQFPDDTWLGKATTLTHEPTRDWRSLPEMERQMLQVGCEPGLALLAEHNVNYIRD